jgi:RHS repeat-associated protein
MSILPPFSMRTNRFGFSISSFSKQVTSVLLVICLLSNTTPAAERTMITMFETSRVDLSFWYNSSRLASWLQGIGSGKANVQEKQRDRDEKVSRIEIFPTDFTVDMSEHVRFTAVAYDVDGNTVGGVKIKWSGENGGPGRRARISKDGDFEANAPGSFTIVAHGAGKMAKVNVTVRPGVKHDLTAPPIGTREVSTRDLPNGEVGKITTKPQKQAVRSRRTNNSVAANTKHAHAFRSASAPNPMMVSNGWDSSNYWAADDPENRVGNPPGGPPDGAGAGNFQFKAPVLALPGRGLQMSLDLSYNSRVWNKAGTTINYDNDRGFPAPGFNFGFGKILGIGIYTGHMLVDADGTRHSYTGSITIYNWGTIGVMRTTDGSFIDYTYQTGTNGVGTWAQARLPNGTVVTYGAYSQSGGGMFPTFIEDANGNYITITYVNNAGPRIQTVTDTAGRVINFHYNPTNLLTAVTAPGLNGGTRTLVRLHYHQHSLGTSFSGLTASAQNYFPWVVDAIYFPATGNGFWLNESDSYSVYGMLAKVVEQRGMGFSSSGLTDMGSVSQGSTTRKETYNYPLSNSSLTDSPSYSQKVEEWLRDGTNFDSATTLYEVHEEETPRRTIITMPNGTKSKQLSFKAPGQWNDGLLYQDETYVTEGQPLQISKSFWEQGAYNSARPYKVEKTDERGQVTATEFTYGSVYNQVTDMRDYNYGGGLLRSVRTTYQNSSVYTGTCNSGGCYGRHIFNLPLTVEIYASDNATRVSRTEYQYDGQTLTAAPGVVMHNQAANPHAEAEGYCYWDYDWNDPDCTGACWEGSWCDGYCQQIWICPYDPSTDFRGNLTQITSYADASGPSSPVTETRYFDVTGNIVKVGSACCGEQTSFTYTVDTQYTYQEGRIRGSATDPFAQVTVSAVYDFYTGLGKSAKDANDKESTITYNPTTLRKQSTNFAGGAHTDYSYDDSAMSVTSTTYLAASEGGAVAAQTVKTLNGRGQVRQEKALATGSTWDIVDTIYDGMGQVSQQTLPYRSGQTAQWINTTYDALGRKKTITAPDTGVTESFYNEPARPSAASSSPGETVRVTDPWGRERWSRADARNQLVEVVEPDPNGGGSVASNGMATTYAYNTLGNLTQITQGDQSRLFKYDALGRLTAQKIAEKKATLNDAGNYVGSGSWTDVLTYDERSNITSRTDARGIKTVYTYNNDPLNRLQSVSWNISGFGDSSYPVAPAGTVTYQYRNKDFGSQRRDVTQMEIISTAGVSSSDYNTSGNTETLAYDTNGRVIRKTGRFNNRVDYPFETDYAYDSLDRMTNLTYPTTYSNGGVRKIAHNDYDVASRLSGLTYDGQSHASSMVYNAASQATSLTVGTGINQVSESYTFNAQTGMLDSQTATRNGTTLLNLSYDYVGANGKRTGQLVKITNNLDPNKNRGYEYDALGRLTRATGGQNVNWAQRYQYDRYGNRSNAFSFTAEQYVRNFYQYGLNRQPNATELQNWLSTLQSAYAQGQSQFLTAMQSLGAAIFTSQEYANRQRSDHEYVWDLYKTYLFREPESSGWQFWENIVSTHGRTHVRSGFEWSTEFNVKVSGISPYSPPGGATVAPDGLKDLAFEVTSNRIANAGWYYDAAGNQTRAQVGAGWQRFQYDAANRLVKVKADDNVTALGIYTYGKSNERLIGEEGGTRTYYHFEGGIAIAEFTESGGATSPTWSRSYIYLNGRLLSKLTPNGSGGQAVQYQHPDRLGTRLVTNPSSGTSSEQVTLPFGTMLTHETTNTDSSRRFTNYERSNASGLDYALNRHYDSQQGRFTQVDPGEMKATSLSNPQTLNLYSYCTNDPVNRVDPDGLGLISFFKKVFNWIKKHWKIILIAVAVAIAIIVIPGAQAFVSQLFSSGGGQAMAAGAAASEGGGIATWLKIVLSGALAATLAAVGTYFQNRQQQQIKSSADQLKDALERARKALGRKSCRDLFGSVSDKMLQVLEQFAKGTEGLGSIVMVDLGGVRVNPRTGQSSITFGEIERLETRNPQGGLVFLGVKVKINSNPAVNGEQGYNNRFGVNNDVNRAITLLHELAHAVDLILSDGTVQIPDDTDKPDLSKQNSQKVFDACFK